MFKLIPKGWTLFLVVTVTLGLTGGGYAAWTTALHVEGTVQTGSVDALWDMQEDSATVGIFNPITGQIVDGPIPDGKDVAQCLSDLEIQGGTARVVNLTVINAYPSYTCEVILGAVVNGSIPVHISKIEKMVTDAAGNDVTGTELNVDVRFTMKVEDQNNLGTFICDDNLPIGVSTQLHNGDRFCAIIRIHANQIAKQNHVYDASVWIELIQWNLAGIREVPIFTIVNPGGLTLAQFQGLQAQLGLPNDAFVPLGNQGGYVQFADTNTFAAVPALAPVQLTVRDEDPFDLTQEAFDLPALQALQVMDPSAAVDSFMNALAVAGVSPSTEYEVVPRGDHTMLQLTNLQGVDSFFGPIDTIVTFDVSLGDMPVVGPGSRVDVNYTPEGVVSQMNYALPEIQRGRMVPVIAAEEAARMVWNVLGGNGLRNDRFLNADVTTELVYLVPAPEDAVAQTLIPHWRVDATFDDGNGGTAIAQTVAIPATLDGLAPKVSLNVIVDGPLVSAQAFVSGGLAPYTYMWNSSIADLSGINQGDVSYTIDLASLKEDPMTEVLSLVVADANGTMVNASEAFNVDGGAIAKQIEANPGKFGGVMASLFVGGTKDVGAESVGAAMNLAGCNTSANGFINRMKTDPGTVARFNWHEFAAWETDFKDVSKGGDDNSWVDNVDAVYYCGHGSGNGVSFPGTNDDGQIHYTEALWGNDVDVEWIHFDACGPLQDGTAPNRWFERWGPAFGRLHLIAGYQTVSWLTTGEGDAWAKYMLQGYTVLQSHIRTAKESQPAETRWAVMGAIRDDNTWNFYDHWWGKGSVGPDITPNRIKGFWKLSGPS